MPAVLSGPADLVTDGLLVGVGAVYLRGVVILRRKGRSWPLRRSAAFFAGLVCLFIALGSIVAAEDDVSVPAHVVQHVLLMMVAPPLLLLGRPLILAAQATTRPVQRQVVRLTRSRTARVLSGWCGWVLFYGSMVAFFLTPLYRLSVENALVHVASHAVLFALGLAYWSGLAGEGSTRLPVGRRLVAVLAGMPIEAGMGLALMAWPGRLAPSVTVTGTHAGGQLFWMLSMLVSGTALVALLVQWAATEDRAARRLEARTAAPRVES